MGKPTSSNGVVAWAGEGSQQYKQRVRGGEARAAVSRTVGDPRISALPCPFKVRMEASQCQSTYETIKMGAKGQCPLRPRFSCSKPSLCLGVGLEGWQAPPASLRLNEGDRAASQ